MSRPLLAAVLALALLAGPARADDAIPPPRLDTLAQQLRERPVAVDADMASYLSRSERRALERDLSAAEIPVRVALLPAEAEDESGGDVYRQLEGLAERVRAPGVYVAVDARGEFEVASVEVPRDVRLDRDLLRGYDLQARLDAADEEAAEAEGSQPVATIAERLRGLSEAVDAAPAAAPGPFDSTAFRRDDLRPVGAERREEPLAGTVALFSVLGLLAGGFLYGLTVAVQRGVEAARRV